MKALSITALILAILGSIIPVVGYYLAGLSGILAAISINKETTVGAVALLINIVALLFMSPLLASAFIPEIAADNPSSATLRTAYIGLLSVQFLGFIVLFVGKALGSLRKRRA